MMSGPVVGYGPIILIDKIRLVDVMVAWSPHKAFDRVQFSGEVIKEKKMTLLINLYGGPGTGKSTCCAGLFF